MATVMKFANSFNKGSTHFSTIMLSMLLSFNLRAYNPLCNCPERFAYVNTVNNKLKYLKSDI